MEEPELTRDGLAKFFDDTNAFSWAFKKDVLNFIKQVTEKGYTPHFALRCIAVRRQAEIEQFTIMEDLQQQWLKRAPRCPKCGNAMRLEPVNSSPGDQVPGSWKSIWYCRNQMNCGHDELSRKTVSQWLKKLGIGPKIKRRPYNQLFEMPKEAMEAADLPEDIDFTD